MFLNYTTKSDKLSKEDACYCNVVKKMPFDKLITSMLMLTGNLPIIELEEQFMPAVILHIAGSTAIEDAYVTELEIYNPITDTIRSPEYLLYRKVEMQDRLYLNNPKALYSLILLFKVRILDKHVGLISRSEYEYQCRR